MNKLITISIFLFYSLINSFGAIAAEPYSDADLIKYGSFSDFDATVLINLGSLRAE